MGVKQVEAFGDLLLLVNNIVKCLNVLMGH
jgi:hypothetical protein